MSKFIRSGIILVTFVIAVFVLGMSADVPRVQAQDPDNADAVVQTWDTNGNNIPKSGFLGTTNNRPLVFKTNNSEKMRILPNGDIGIGTNSPKARLHIAGGQEVLLQGPDSGAANEAYFQWNDSAGTSIGYVGDGSSGDTDTYLASYASNVHLYAPAGYVLLDGNVGIAMQNPSARLHIRNDGNSDHDGVRVENPNGDILFGVRNNGALYYTPIDNPTTSQVCYHNTVTAVKYLVGCSSAAEYVPSIDGGHGYPETADLVSIAPEVQNPYGDTHGPFTAQKSATACDSNLLGYIVKPESGADGVKLNDHYLPLAIFGYFPAKVTMENGMIKRGDPITSSSKVGYGMKATGACKVIGYALQDASAEGTIQVFANAGENTLPELARLRQENLALKEQLASFEARLAALEAATPGIRIKQDVVLK